MQSREELDALAERTRVLGYKPQKELVYNHLLPYADRLDEESDQLLSQIKTNFAKAVVLKELKPGCSIWTARLIKYIKLYGLKFSKEVHIELINLVYELIIVPHLEPTKLHKFCTLLVLLTKKVYLITPQELTIQWKPLYKLGRKVFGKSSSSVGMFHYPSLKRVSDDDDHDDDDDNNGQMSFRQLREMLERLMPSLDDKASTDDNESLESTFGIMVQFLKPYFPQNATREILDELLPKFIPWNSPSQESIQDLVLYLPYIMWPEYKDDGFKLWLDDFMQLWQVCHNSPVWETDMMSLIANVGFNNIGLIDWEPHLALMFTRFLRSFNLPVFYRHTQNNKQHNIETSGMSLWIVAVLGPKSTAQDHLDNFMTTVATYLHGANTGRWSGRLRDLVRKLPGQFVHRVHMERAQYKKTWEYKTPDSHKLTDNDIDRFVKCMLDVSLQTMFSRLGTTDACIALQQLALLRPSVVIPPIIDKMWSTLDSLTEPHKLTSAMQCVVAVARPLVSGFNNGYPDGPTHVIPLLFSCLPGLDPNDFKKTLVTLHFIAVFANLVPFVDCSGASNYWPDLSEEECNVCETTAQFEDFVMQFLDRVFVLVESSSMEHTRMEQKEAESIKSKLESTSEGALASTALAVLVQLPKKMFINALRKMFNFVTERILETNVAGQTAASLCRAFSRVNAHETFKIFIPYLCKSIETFCKNEDSLKEESLDKGLLFNLLLLSQVVEKNGVELLVYMPDILRVLDKILTISCKEGYGFVCTIIKNVLMCLCCVYPEKCRSSTGNYDASVEEFLAIKDWGKPGNVWQRDLKWHIPNQDEVNCVQSIIQKYLPSLLEIFDNYVDGKSSLSREELNKSLSIVKSLLIANSLMPPWEDEPVKLVESSVEWKSFHIFTGVSTSICMPDGGNVRQAISKTMHALQKKLLSSNEDDTKSLCKLITIWELLTARNTVCTALYETHLKIFNAVKRSLEDKLSGRPGHLRVLLADRVLLQHEFRIQAISGPITVSQADNMLALLTLATSRYSEVRSQAQCRLNWMVLNYAYSFSIIVPKLISSLEVDPNVDHECLKGALYCLLGPKPAPIIAKPQWNVVGKLWPAVIHSKPSEKPSVIRLLDSVLRCILIHFPTITIHLKWSDRAIDAAKALLTESEFSDPKFVELQKTSEDAVKKVGDDNEEIYKGLLDVLVQGADSPNLHWRHSMLCVSLISPLVHLDVHYPPNVINLILRFLIHDSLLIRKISLKLMVYVLRQKKKKHIKTVIETSQLNGLPSDVIDRQVIPGYRADNAWIQYDDTKVWTQEEWNDKPFTHDDCMGYYYWPLTLKMYAPLNEQPESKFDTENFDEGERDIFNFFTCKENIDKLIGYLSMEEKKGRDKFNSFRYMMFKGLFINYMDAFLPALLERLHILVSDKQESLQRCASEIIAGIIRGTKFWPYDKIEKLKIELTPILRKMFENFHAETISDWATCFATAFENMNITRLNWVVQLLEEDMLENTNSSQLCGRLFLYQASIIQHPWRFAAHSKLLLNKIRDKGMLAHPYQNVRDRIASILTGLFDKDILFPGGVQNVAPSISEFIESVMPAMEYLLKDGMKGVSISNNHRGPILPFPTNKSEPENNGNDSVQELLNKHSLNISSDKVKAIIQDSINKSGLEMETINRATISKLLQEVKKANPQGENMKDFENGAKSPSEVFISNASFLEKNHSKHEHVPFMEILEDDLSTILKISDDKLSPTSNSEKSKQDTEYDVNVRLFKTVLKFVTNTIIRNTCGVNASFYKLIPVVCVLGSREGDEEIYLLSSAFLSTVGESLHSLENLYLVFDKIDQVCQSPSWCARVSCLSFFQSLVFHNMPLVVSSPLKLEVRRITLNLMNDSCFEVRDAAAMMFAGLLHCSVLTDIPELIKHFKSMCKGKKLQKGPDRAEALARRHCGVLGLCAFIAAQPYSVPPYLPEIFSLLGKHINDPMPIPATIRKTLGDFKRTHHDDWQTHKLKFTEEELAILSDLAVPPSYYA